MRGPVIRPVAFSIPEGKLTGYLLDPDHRDGASKARFFTRFGFRRDDHRRLAQALLAHATDMHFVGTALTPLGQTKYVYEGPIEAPDGRSPRIRTVWRVRPDDWAVFVTAVPLTD